MGYGKTQSCATRLSVTSLVNPVETVEYLVLLRLRYAYSRVGYGYKRILMIAVQRYRYLAFISIFNCIFHKV